MALEMLIEARVAAPPERVYEVLLDLDRAREWMPGLVGIERLNDVEGAVGAKWRETRKMFGKEASEVFEVTALEPGKGLELYVDGAQGSSRRGYYRFRYELESSEAGSTVKVHCEMGGMGLMGAVMGRLFSGVMKKSILKDFAALDLYLTADD